MLPLEGSPRPCRGVSESCRNLGDVFRARTRATPDRVACWHKEGGAWQRTDWQGFFDLARGVAGGYVRLGLEPGDRVSILGPTSLDWAVFDLAGHLTGLVPVGIYPKQAPEQVRYLLEHSGSRIVLVDSAEELATVVEAARDLDVVEAIVPWSDDLAAEWAERDPRIVSIREIRDGAPLSDEVVDERLACVGPDDLAMLIYTSGTTGPPKGAMISHGNVLALLGSHTGLFEFHEDDLMIAFLPMAHASERNLAFYGRINVGVAAAYASSIGAVLAELPEVAPTVFGSVPRLFEKAYAKVRGELASKPNAVRSLFGWAERVGRETFETELAGRRPGVSLRLRRGLAQRLVHRKVQAAFGGRVRACITGAAPISREILDFFWSIGMPIFEVYGMTEATVATHANRIGQTKIGTVGRPIPPMRQRLAPDGEIQLAGPFVFQGYLHNEEATREALLGDGWLATGDIGEIDDDGYLRITDRKKHLIITAGGKNLAPANIEKAIKSRDPRISQVHAHGDRRPFVSALIAPSPIETLQWGREHGILSPEEVDTLTKEILADPQARKPSLDEAMGRVAADERFPMLFRDAVMAGNRELARVERVRRFVVLGRDLSQEHGELTPTMKVKRKVVETSFADLFEKIYSGEAGIDAEPPGGDAAAD